MGQFFRCSIYFKGVPTKLMSKKNTTEQFPWLSNTLVTYFFCVWYVTLQLRFSSCGTHWALVNYACAFVVDDDFFMSGALS